MYKDISKCQIGDYVRKGDEVYQIVGELKTQFVVAPLNQTKKSAQKKITKKTGKVVGSYGSDRMRALREDESPESIAQARQEALDKRQSEHEEREARWQAKVDAVIDVNGRNEIKNLKMGLKKFEFKNKAGQDAMLLFQVTPEVVDWDDDFNEVAGFEVDAVYYGPRWRDEKKNSFSMPSNQRAVKVKDALIAIIAGTYWD